MVLAAARFVDLRPYSVVAVIATLAYKPYT